MSGEASRTEPSAGYAAASRVARPWAAPLRGSDAAKRALHRAARSASIAWASARKRVGRMAEPPPP